jgi:hypothetical protein
VRRVTRAAASSCLAVAAVAATGGIAACSSGGGAATPTTFVAIDGSPRAPDVAGVVDEIAEDFSTIVIDGDSYGVSDALQSFSSIDGSTQPLRRRLDQYVHAGVDGDTVVWIAGIGAVVEAGERPAVYYQGTVAALDDGRRRIALEDGTVLEIADGVDAPEPGAAILATIDVTRDEVVEVVEAA